MSSQWTRSPLLSHSLSFQSLTSTLCHHHLIQRSTLLLALHIFPFSISSLSFRPRSLSLSVLPSRSCCLPSFLPRQFSRSASSLACVSSRSASMLLRSIPRISVLQLIGDAFEFCVFFLFSLSIGFLPALRFSGCFGIIF